MPRFFCNNITKTNAIISGEDARHISKVLRMTVGDKLILCDMKGFDYNCEILEIADEINLKVLNFFENETESPLDITLYQCLPKSDKLEFIIQKAVELGVNKIIPVQSEFCTARISQNDFKKKLVRYNKIAYEAAKQSGRGRVAEVLNIVPFNDALKLCQSDTTILFYEKDGKKVSEILSDKASKVSLLIGSEGGFSKTEIELAKNANVRLATLGKRILRCETAPLVGISLVLHEAGEI